MNGSNPDGLIFSEALSGFQTVTATQLDYVGPEALRAYEAFDTIDGAPLQTSQQIGGGPITNLGERCFCNFFRKGDFDCSCSSRTLCCSREGIVKQVDFETLK